MMMRFTRQLFLILSFALTLGLAEHAVGPVGMDMTTASVASASGAKMVACDSGSAKTMKSSALCYALCFATVAIAFETSTKPEVATLLADYGPIPDVLADGRVPAVNRSPPRTTPLI